MSDDITARDIHRFTDGKPWVATQANCEQRWGFRENGFSCRLCGHKFKPGDTVRWQYLNDTPGGTGNVLVCAGCDGTKAEIHAKAMVIIEQIKHLRDMGWIE